MSAFVTVRTDASLTVAAALAVHRIDAVASGAARGCAA
jgi:hypothetical protein